MLPDYLIQATLLHYGPDAAALVSETICRWEHDKWPEENSFLAVELYRQAYPYFAAHEALSSVGINPDEFLKSTLAHQPKFRLQ